jgi:hypothetical protein
MKHVEEIMTETVPWELVAGLNGKINGGFEFDIEKLFIHLIKLYGLEEKAKRGEVEKAITIDRVELDSKVANVYFGFKLPNKDSVCSIREQHLFMKLIIFRVANGASLFRLYLRRTIVKMKNSLTMSSRLSGPTRLGSVRPEVNLQSRSHTLVLDN